MYIVRLFVSTNLLTYENKYIFGEDHEINFLFQSLCIWLILQFF